MVGYVKDIRAEHRARFGLMTEEELADMLDVKPHTLAVWRTEGKGPHSVRLAKSVFYREEDIHTWIKENLTISKRMSEE
jgi:predicted site-specific integrase-resolvase